MEAFLIHILHSSKSCMYNIYGEEDFSGNERRHSYAVRNRNNITAAHETTQTSIQTKWCKFSALVRFDRLLLHPVLLHS